MNKETKTIIFTGFTLALSLSMLSGCGGGSSSETTTAATTAAPTTSAASDTSEDYIDISGDWDNDDLEATLTLYDDGTLVMYQAGAIAEGTYEWDGTELITIALEGDNGTYEGFLDEEGDLVFDEIDGWFYYVDSGAYASDPEEDEEDSSEVSYIDELDLEGTAWVYEPDPENNFAFLADGIFVAYYDDYSLIALGTYTWDGTEGYAELDGDSVAIAYDGESFGMQAGPDDEFYPLTYTGAPDLDMLLPNDVDDSEMEANDYGFEDEGGDYMSGSYDNDSTETSLVFYPDGTVYFHNDGEEYEASYELYSDGTLDLIFNGQVDEGYIYDSDTDTITEPSFGTTYYPVSEAGY